MTIVPAHRADLRVKRVEYRLSQALGYGTFNFPHDESSLEELSGCRPGGLRFVFAASVGYARHFAHGYTLPPSRAHWTLHPSSFVRKVFVPAGHLIIAQRFSAGAQRKQRSTSGTAEIAVNQWPGKTI
jgi:hypothetical protein